MEDFHKKLSEYSDYFDIIRKKIMLLGIVFLGFFVLGFLESGFIIKFILSIFDLEKVTVITNSPFQFLNLATKIGVVVGIFALLPLFLYHVYNFIKDGLNKKERKLFFILLFTSLILFIVGFIYCFVILYFYISSISKINLAFGINNVWDINSFLSQIILASVFFGLVFQFPIALTFLIKFGILKIDYLRKKRRYAIAFIFIFVGFLPPPDIFSTIFQALPLILMYEITIRVNSVIRPKNEIIYTENTEKNTPLLKEAIKKPRKTNKK